MRTNTSSEFVLWKAFFDSEANAFNPIHHYLAQIAFEVHRSRVKNPGRVKFEKFLLKFVAKKDDPAPATPEEASARSKSFWLSLCGYGLPKNVKANVKKPPPKKKG